MWNQPNSFYGYAKHVHACSVACACIAHVLLIDCNMCKSMRVNNMSMQSPCVSASQGMSTTCKGFQFMPISLSKLIVNRHGYQYKFKHFTLLKSQFPDQLDLICLNGFYPYAWLDDIKSEITEDCHRLTRCTLLENKNIHQTILYIRSERI